MKSPNVKWHEGNVTKEDRTKLLGYKNKVLWFTGLSGSGKSTLANETAKQLHKKDVLTYVLDGDNIRHGLNSDLGFSKSDRKENIRRIAEVAKLFYDSGVFVLVCFISPYQKERDYARKLIGNDFIEIYLKCSLEECERRDTKGLYKKARNGELLGFTGISDLYETPKKAELILDTENKNVETCVDEIMVFIDEKA